MCPADSGKRTVPSPPPPTSAIWQPWPFFSVPVRIVTWLGPGRLTRQRVKMVLGLLGACWVGATPSVCEDSTPMSWDALRGPAFIGPVAWPSDADDAAEIARNLAPPQEGPTSTGLLQHHTNKYAVTSTHARMLVP